MALTPDTKRDLRGATLQLMQAERDRADAIAAAHANGASITDLAGFLRLDAFEVRDILVAAGALKPLAPKEAAARSQRSH